MVSRPLSSRTQAVQLGAELRERRRRAGLTVVGVAERLGIHQSTVSRWERGEAKPSVADVGALLALYGVTGEDRDDLVEFAGRDGEQDWFSAGGVQQLGVYTQCESLARTVTEVIMSFVPGLLQTREYCYSLMTAAGTPAAEATRWTDVRMRRQRVLTRPRPVHLIALFGEAVARYPACDPEVMRGQLGHLLAMSERPNVEIRLIPFDLGRYTLALEGTFLVLEFAQDTPIVKVEGNGSSSLLTTGRRTGRYLDMVARIKDDALDEERSRKRLVEIDAELESRRERSAVAQE